MENIFENHTLEETLRSSKIVAGGFMGDDTRDVSRIIEDDAEELKRLGYSAAQVADRMQHLTNCGKKGIETPIVVDDKWQVVCQEYKGFAVSPWPESKRFDKRITTVQRLQTGVDAKTGKPVKSIRWTDLNIHLIRMYGFFEGRGCAYRIEPKELIEMIF